MLTPPVNDFGWFVDNFGTTYSDAGLGTSIAGGAANTKGSDTQLLVGLAEDCYFLQIGFCNQGSSAATRRFMADIKVDTAAGVGGSGSSWSTIIANLAANNASMGAGFGQWYGFPLFIPAGAAIAAAIQCSTTTITSRMLVRAFGKPSHPELCPVGSKVQTLGASAGTTVGTTVVPGTSSKGSYSASLGTLSARSFWFQCGILSNDTTMTAGAYLFDVAVDATTKYLAMRDMPYIVTGAAEQASKAMAGASPPMFDAQSGAAVYVRGVADNGAPDSSMSAVVYAVSP